MRPEPPTPRPGLDDLGMDTDTPSAPKPTRPRLHARRMDAHRALETLALVLDATALALSFFGVDVGHVLAVLALLLNVALWFWRA